MVIVLSVEQQQDPKHHRIVVSVDGQNYQYNTIIREFSIGSQEGFVINTEDASSEQFKDFPPWFHSEVYRLVKHFYLGDVVELPVEIKWSPIVLE